MQVLNRLFNFIRTGVTEISSWLVLLVTVLITADVIFRYAFKASIPAGLEITEVLLVIMVFFAFGKSQEDNVHVRVEFLIKKIPPKARYCCEIVVYCMALLFVFLTFWGATDYFLDSYAMKEYSSAVVPVPIYPARGAIVIGCALMMIRLCMNIASLLRSKGKVAFDPSLEQREIEESIAKIEGEEKQ